MTGLLKVLCFPAVPDLQAKSVVWAKYGTSPHWPALVSMQALFADLAFISTTVQVTSVKKKKSKLIPSVYFFGYSDLFP